MKLYKNTDDLPKWFNLKNYDCIAELSTSEIKKQVRFRTDLIDSAKRAYDENETDDNGDLYLFEYEEGKRYEQITNGNVVLIDFENIEMERIHKEIAIANGRDYKRIDYRLPRTQTVSGYTTVEAYFHSLSLMDEDLIKDDGKYIAFKEELLSADVNITDKLFDAYCSSGFAAINIHLEGYTDKEIIADIIKLLPEWRKCLGIEEPCGISYSKELDYKKIVSYRIIPLLDLLLHEKINNKKFPLRVLATALYPKGEKGENELKQTVIPLALRITSDNYRHLD